MVFRENLLLLRQQRNMTQEQLAMLMGVSRQAVTKWEDGQATPNVDKLVKLANLFGCTLDDLVSGSPAAIAPKSAEVLPEIAPVNDICGYDEQSRTFAFRIALGAAMVVAGAAAALPFGGIWASLAPNFAQTMAPSALPIVLAILGVGVGAALVISAVLGQDAFARAHPYVQDFYEPIQKAHLRSRFVYSLACGTLLIAAGLLVAALLDSTRWENLAASAMLLCVASGIGIIAYSGLLYQASDLGAYNGENGLRWNAGRICCATMTAATIIGLGMAFFGTAGALTVEAGSPDGWARVLLTFFWVPWPLGSACCGLSAIRMLPKSRKTHFGSDTCAADTTES